MNIEVANRLQQLRKAKGLSQEELAQILGLSRQAISKWERAETSPDTDNLICLAKLYNISIDKLLDTGESMEEIKERIAQERISEINMEKDNIHEEISEDNCEVVDEDKVKQIVDTIIEPQDRELSKEEKELDEKAENKWFRVVGCSFLASIVAYLLIGITTKDWSWGWGLIIVALFGSSSFIGLFDEKQFSPIGFSFSLIGALLCIGEAYDSIDNVFVLMSAIIVISIISFMSIVGFIIYIIFAFKNRKDLDLLYHKKRLISERKKCMEIVYVNKKYKDALGKIKDN